MTRSASSLLLAFALLVPAVSPGRPAAARADGGDAGKGPKGGVFPDVTDASADEAKAAVEALKKALEGKDDEKVAAAIAPMVKKRHADFVPELKKLLADKRDSVAGAAAEALGSQADKGAATLLAKVVAADTREKGILKDPLLKSAAIEALGRLGGGGAFDAVHKLSDAMVREPEVRYRYAPRISKACVRYYGLTKEKRAVSWLIDEVEKPNLKGSVLPSSPPADYWKYRQDIWTEVRYEAVWALKEITGKEFESTARWEAWFNGEGKKAGMK